MRTTNYRISVEAQRDLDAIFLYVAEEAGVRAADGVIDRVFRQILRCANFPKSSYSADEIFPGSRRVPVGSYLIYYRETRKFIEILRILHGARDQKSAARKRS